MMLYSTEKSPAVAWVKIDSRRSFDVPGSVDPVTGNKKRMSGYYGHTGDGVLVEFYIFEEDKLKYTELAGIGPEDLVLVCTRSLEIKNSRFTPNTHPHSAKCAYKFVSPVIPFMKQRPNKKAVWRDEAMKQLLSSAHSGTLEKFREFFIVFAS